MPYTRKTLTVRSWTELKEAVVSSTRHFPRHNAAKPRNKTRLGGGDVTEAAEDEEDEEDDDNRRSYTATTLEEQADYRVILYSTRLSHDEWLQVCMCLAYMKGLIYLDLGCIGLEDEGVEQLCGSLVKSGMFSLQQLLLGGNRISNEGCAAIGRWLRTNQSVRVLNLRFNAIEDDGVVGLCEGLVSHPCVAHINLSSNLIGDVGAAVEALGDAIKRNLSIERLELFGNEIEAAGAKALASACQARGSTPMALDLWCNNIGLAGAFAFSTALNLFAPSSVSPECISELYLGKNGLGDEGTSALCHGIERAKCLTILDLSGNCITSFGARNLAKAVSVNQSLSKVLLRDNVIQADGCFAVLDVLRVEPVSHCDIHPSLTHINLAGNEVSQDECAEIVAMSQTVSSQAEVTCTPPIGGTASQLRTLNVKRQPAASPPQSSALSPQSFASQPQPQLQQHQVAYQQQQQEQHSQESVLSFSMGPTSGGSPSGLTDIRRGSGGSLQLMNGTVVSSPVSQVPPVPDTLDNRVERLRSAIASGAVIGTLDPQQPIGVSSSSGFVASSPPKSMQANVPPSSFSGTEESSDWIPSFAAPPPLASSPQAAAMHGSIYDGNDAKGTFTSTVAANQHVDESVGEDIPTPSASSLPTQEDIDSAMHVRLAALSPRGVMSSVFGASPTNAASSPPPRQVNSSVDASVIDMLARILQQNMASSSPASSNTFAQMSEALEQVKQQRQASASLISPVVSPSSARGKPLSPIYTGLSPSSPLPPKPSELAAQAKRRQQQQQQQQQQHQQYSDSPSYSPLRQHLGTGLHSTNVPSLLTEKVSEGGRTRSGSLRLTNSEALSVSAILDSRPQSPSALVTQASLRSFLESPSAAGDGSSGWAKVRKNREAIAAMSSTTKLAPQSMRGNNNSSVEDEEREQADAKRQQERLARFRQVAETALEQQKKRELAKQEGADREMDVEEGQRQASEKERRHAGRQEAHQVDGERVQQQGARAMQASSLAAEAMRARSNKLETVGQRPVSSVSEEEEVESIASSPTPPPPPPPRPISQDRHRYDEDDYEKQIPSRRATAGGVMDDAESGRPQSTTPRADIASGASPTPASVPTIDGDDGVEDGGEATAPTTTIGGETFSARVLADFEGHDARMLTIRIGEIVTVLGEDAGWLMARNSGGDEGYIPPTFVDFLEGGAANINRS